MPRCGALSNDPNDPVKAALMSVRSVLFGQGNCCGVISAERKKAGRYPRRKKHPTRLKKGLPKGTECYIITFVADIGLSPNGKATDSDSVISRFESL